MSKIYSIVFSVMLTLILSSVFLYADDKSDLNVSKKKYEIEAGVGYGILNYHVDTAANSLLKWRDSSNFQQNVNFKYYITEKYSAGILFENYILSGGEMTDDDLNNLYGSDYGIFNTTRNMKGSGYRFDVYGGYHYYTSGNTDFIGTFGIFLRKYKIKPKGVLQVGVLPDGHGVNYDNENTQHTEITYKGFQLGTEVHHNSSDSSKFIFDIKLTIPLIHKSKQYYWGYEAPDYDWKLEQYSFLKNRGIDLKIENRFRLNERFWWGVYAYYSYMKSTDQDEIDWTGGGYAKVGNANSSELSMMGAGISLYF
jgi:hypothetical protein